MVDITEEELTIVENALERVLTDLEAAATESPEAQELMQQVVDAQQIISSKIEGSSSDKSMAAEGSISGPGV
jgi:hypothetical protein